MKEVDYLVVGLGIAGICLTERLAQRGKSVMVIDEGVHASTVVSGGVFNPAVLKRFTAAWNASQFIEDAFAFYQNVSSKLKIELMAELPILRILNSVEEQNNWSIASDKSTLSTFLSSEISTNYNPAIAAPFGFGRVIGAGRIFPSELITAYKSMLLDEQSLIVETFNYEALSISEEIIHYKNKRAKHIIFAQGAMAVENPFFPSELLVPNKGEYIIIHAPSLKLEAILKGSMMIIPLGNDTYKVGATYNKDDQTHHTTEDAREEIVVKLKKMIRCNFEVIDQVAGVRPTVKDRKPLLGALPKQKNCYFFNGLGTRGILMAPTLSEVLINHIEKNVPLPLEIDINRFS